MSDLIHVSVGTEPWTPTADSRIVEMLREYDRPLSAIVEQAGIKYLVHCFFGEMGDVNAWVYVRLDEHEAVELSDGANLIGTIDYLTEGHHVVALAADDKVVLSLAVDIPQGSWPDRVPPIAAAIAAAIERARVAEGVIHQVLVDDPRGRVR